MNWTHGKFKKYFLAILFAVILILLPIHPAEAAVGMFGIGSIATGAITTVFGWFLYFIFSSVGKIISLLATGLYYVINIPVYPSGGLAVIDSSWKIMRDFANMFFIVALIMMAFATIFDILPGAAKYNARTLFGRFLLTALLINFSLVLGVMVIQGTQVLSNTFLVSIGDMSNRLGQGLVNSLPIRADQISANTVANTLDSAVFGTIITLIFSIVLLFTFAFSLLTAFLFALIRIPILWALLVVSPIAWILNMFPAGQVTFRKWWSTFIGWNMFLPIFLFFLYFGLYFLQNQGDVLSKIAAQTANQHLGGSSFTLQILFFYILSGVFLIGGTIVAMKASMFSGTGVVGIAKWSRGIAARRLGLTAAGGAAQQRLEQVKEEGLPGKLGVLYGGKYGLEQQTGGFAQRFGVRGAETRNQKAFVDRAGKDYADFERQYQNGQITEAEIISRAKQLDATDPRGFAYRKLAAKIGQLDNDTFTSTLTQLSKNPLAAEDFTKTASASKFSKMKGSDLARIAAAERGTDPTTGIPYDYTSLRGSVAARREMFRYVQTDTKAMSGLKDPQIEAGLGVFGGHTTAEGKAFLKEIGKINPSFAVGYNSDGARNPDLRTDVEDGFEKAYTTDPAHPVRPANEFQLKTHVFGSFLKSGDMKDTANIKKDTWETSPEFREAMKLYISQLKGQARKNYVNRLERALLDTAGGDKKLEILDTVILSSPTTTGVMTGGRIPPTAPTSPL
ncbi:MAG: hypothetical protein A2915_04560 [Candidatus Yanofskybacteria bacterium RIFCSPLOWO2_01_FULL_41_34]|uniref:Uncharacterized protein n=1 Tax=Candidatus Yanofskybacteria bacterium RIFCSPHIGHO2_01_FULL_41_26 TaxID=1802661 RepID=A0A1F8EE17_9BACT|nr:MAG: hypothetical protein A2649_03665 [Candidatus Yanofskybacteria bacterium RIFCSPHIGHO2_01_FULL_41_26]OGN21668.1 MAG: hypothetical protein A2915_04560 [Candidatus Yanofskybacteria bacterium RIFCSPLOWO2_01_FULL_41_34]